MSGREFCAFLGTLTTSCRVTPCGAIGNEPTTTKSTYRIPPLVFPYVEMSYITQRRHFALYRTTYRSNIHNIFITKHTNFSAINFDKRISTFHKSDIHKHPELNHAYIYQSCFSAWREYSKCQIRNQSKLHFNNFTPFIPVSRMRSCSIFHTQFSFTQGILHTIHPAKLNHGLK